MNGEEKVTTTCRHLSVAIPELHGLSAFNPRNVLPALHFLRLQPQALNTAGYCRACPPYSFVAKSGKFQSFSSLDVGDTSPERLGLVISFHYSCPFNQTMLGPLEP